VRRFSQRSSLVTLSEINITPLLDLGLWAADYLINTTPLLDKHQSAPPPGGIRQNRSPPRTCDGCNHPRRAYLLNPQRRSLVAIERQWVQEFKYIPNLVSYSSRRNGL
jgi:hypothetical protein